MAHDVSTLGFDAADTVARISRIAFDTAFPWMAGIHTPDEYVAFYRDRIFPTCAVSGVRIGGALAGFLAQRDNWIEQLYILPDHQRCGIGSALVAQAKSTSDTLSLWCFERNVAARAFYAVQGFRALSRRDGSQNAEREPDMLYRWDVR